MKTRWLGAENEEIKMVALSKTVDERKQQEELQTTTAVAPHGGTTQMGKQKTLDKSRYKYR